MPEVTQIDYTHAELTATLIREQGIHQGNWMIRIVFRQLAGNYPTEGGAMLPGAVSLIQSIGLQKVEEPTGLSVDAAAVNPATVIVDTRKVGLVQ